MYGNHFKPLKLIHPPVLLMSGNFKFNPWLVTNSQFHQLRSTCADILSYLPSTTVAKTLHDRINLLLKDLSQLGAVLVDSGCFTIVQPGVIEHEPDVIHILPGILVLTYNQNTDDELVKWLGSLEDPYLGSHYFNIEHHKSAMKL